MKQAALLKTKEENLIEPYKIVIRLQEGKSATFTYSDKELAYGHFDFLRTTMVIGGMYIREITFDKPK